MKDRTKTVENDSSVLSKNKGEVFGRMYRDDRWRNRVYVALKDTKFFLLQSGMTARSEVEFGSVL